MADSPSPLETGRNVDHKATVLALRPAEAAKALAIGTRLLWSMTNRGEIPCVKIGRRTVYAVESLRAWLAAQANKTR